MGRFQNEREIETLLNFWKGQNFAKNDKHPRSNVFFQGSFFLFFRFQADSFWTMFFFLALLSLVAGFEPRIEHLLETCQGNKKELGTGSFIENFHPLEFQHGPSCSVNLLEDIPC